MPRRNHPRKASRPIITEQDQQRPRSYQGMAHDLVDRGLASPAILGQIGTERPRRQQVEATA